MTVWLGFIFRKSVLLALLGLAFLLFAMTLWHRYAYIDDCWFGEQAYWMAKLGIVKTPTIQAGLGWEERLMVYHKLNIWLGALIILAAGWSVYFLKTITLLVYLSFFCLLYRYLLKPVKEDFHVTFLLAGFLVFANPIMFIFGFSYRPEILVMVSGFLSFMMLEKIRTSENDGYGIAVIGGLASGIAFLAHLNGLIFGLAGLIYLMIYKKYRSALVFTLSASVIASVYFIDLLPTGNFTLFLQQISNWPDEISGNYLKGESAITNVFIKLSNEHQRFFWSDKVAVFSGLFFFSLIVSFRYLVKNHRPLLIYTGLLILLLNLTGSHIAERYLIYYLPMMALIITFSMINLFKEKRLIMLTFSVLILAAQMIVLSGHWYKIMQRNSNFTSDNHLVSNSIPDDCKLILAPYSYIFNEIESHPLLTYHSLEYYEVKHQKKLSGHEAVERCLNLGVDCIIVDKGLIRDKEKYRWFESIIDGHDSDFKVFRNINGYLILTRNHLAR